MTLSPRLLHALDTLKLQVRQARASVGTGERPSRIKGAGMEFADYRSYMPGDDLRRLDARLYARHGTFNTREYETQKQLPVLIAIDGSGSMRQGSPAKIDIARFLSECLGYVALAGSDQVRLCLWDGTRFIRSDVFSGAMRAQRMFGWVDGTPATGNGSFTAALEQVVNLAAPQSLVVVLSDFWVEDPGKPLREIVARGAELWAFQILTPEEIDPGAHAGGPVELIDAETEGKVVMTIDSAALAEYRRQFEAWQNDLQAATSDLGARHFLIRTDDVLDDMPQRLRLAGALV